MILRLLQKMRLGQKVAINEKCKILIQIYLNLANLTQP